MIPNMKIQKSIPRRRSFRARHNCDNSSQEQRQDIGLVESGKMKLKEFTDIDIDKKEDIGYDIILRLKMSMRDDPMFYRKMYFHVWLIKRQL